MNIFSDNGSISDSSDNEASGEISAEASNKVYNENVPEACANNLTIDENIITNKNETNDAQSNSDHSCICGTSEENSFILVKEVSN